MEFAVPILASIGGDLVAWTIWAIGSAALVMFWYFVMSHFGSF